MREGDREEERWCVGKRQGSTHTADTAAWVKSWNMMVSFPPIEETLLPFASLFMSPHVLSGLGLPPCLYTSRLVLHTVILSYHLLLTGRPVEFVFAD